MDSENQFKEERLLKIPDMAKEMCSSAKTVRRRIDSGTIKAAFKEGGRWVIWRSALLVYLRHSKPTADRGTSHV
jgi:Helix-turn-helix domain